MQLVSAKKVKMTRISTLYLTLGITGYHYHSESVIKLPARGAGDVTRIHAKCEVTSLLPYMVMLGCFLSYGKVTNTSIAPPALSSPRTQDLNSAFSMHYRIDESTIITDEDLNAIGMALDQPEGWPVSLVLYAASTATKPYDYLTVENASYSEFMYEHFSTPLVS